MKAGLSLEQQLFLTERKDKSPLFHPGVLDDRLEEFLKTQEKVQAISNTGLSKPLEHDSMAEFKQLVKNFELHDMELIASQHTKVKSAARESAKQERIRRQKRRSVVEAMDKHKNEKVLEKLTVADPELGYYERVPIKPGFDFFNCLMRAPRRDLQQLAVNVPNTLYFKDKIFHMYTGPDGFLRCNDDASYYEFYRQVSATHQKGPQPFNKVAAILRMRGESYSDVRKQVLDWNIFQSKMNNHDLNPMSMVQQYIRCPGGRPGVVRLFYYSYGNDSKANYALFINSLGLDYHSSTQSEELNKCVVDTKRPELLEVFKQAGGALKPYEAEAAKIVQFLNAGYNLRVSEIVLDFIKDEAGVIWLSGCKRILFDEASLKAALKPKKMAWEDVSEESDSFRQLEEKKDRFKSCVRCQLCRLVYPNFELNNLVSLHMLITYKQHAVKRRDLPWDTSHLKFATKDQLSQCVRVCQFCYLLLTTELDLMETERSLALRLSIPFKDQTLTEDPRLEVQLQFLPKQLMQWRFLCLFDQFMDLRLPNQKGLCLAFKFSSHRTFFPIEDFSEALNCMKVNYFYHQQQKSPKQFFDTNVSELRLTRGTNWSRWVAKSSVQMLKDFPHDFPPGHALIQSMNTIMFDRNMEPMLVLKLKAGVSADHLVNSKNIKSVMDKNADIYIPEVHYFTTDPLPPAWMELFDCVQEQVSTDDEVEKDIYVPKLSHAELMRMEDITSPMRKSNVVIKFDHAPFYRCCSGHTHEKVPKFTREKRVEAQTSGVPRLDLGEMTETTGEEVKKMHSSVSEFLGKRPVTAGIRPISAATVKATTKKGSLERTQIFSTRMSSRLSNSGSTLGTPSTRRKAFERQMWLINQYAGEVPL